MDELVMLFHPDGTAKCLWTDDIDLYALGNVTTTRASDVIFNPDKQEWEVTLPEGTVVASHKARETAINMEIDYLQRRM